MTTGNELIPLLYHGQSVRVRDVPALRDDVRMPLLRPIHGGDTAFAGSISKGEISDVSAPDSQFPLVSGGGSISLEEVQTFEDLPVSVSFQADDADLNDNGSHGSKWAVGDHFVTGWNGSTEPIECAVTGVLPATPGGGDDLELISDDTVHTGTATEVDAETKTITVTGDITAWLAAGFPIDLTSATAEAEMTAIVVSATFDTDHTDVVIVEDIIEELTDPELEDITVSSVPYIAVDGRNLVAEMQTVFEDTGEFRLFNGSDTVEFWVPDAIVLVSGDTRVFLRGLTGDYSTWVLTSSAGMTDFDVTTPGISRGGNFSCEPVEPAQGSGGSFTIRL